MLQKNKYLIRKESFYTCFFALLFTLFFCIFYLSSYATFSYVVRFKLSNKLMSIFHDVAITLLAICFLTARINQAQFARLISIARGYLIYDIVVIVIFYDIHEDVPTTFLKLAKVFMFVVHHLVFLWVTYQVGRYPRLMAQGLLAEFSKLPFYSWYIIKKFGLDFVILDKLLMITSLIGILILKELNFSIISLTIWRFKKKTRAELFGLFALFLFILFGAAEFGRIYYEGAPNF